jgi:hypothetical protein
MDELIAMALKFPVDPTRTEPIGQVALTYPIDPTWAEPIA